MKDVVPFLFCKQVYKEEYKEIYKEILQKSQFCKTKEKIENNGITWAFILGGYDLERHALYFAAIDKRYHKKIIKSITMYNDIEMCQTLMHTKSSTLHEWKQHEGF